MNADGWRNSSCPATEPPRGPETVVAAACYRLRIIKTVLVKLFTKTFITERLQFMLSGPAYSNGWGAMGCMPVHGRSPSLYRYFIIITL